MKEQEEDAGEERDDEKLILCQEVTGLSLGFAGAAKARCRWHKSFPLKCQTLIGCTPFDVDASP